MSETLTFKARPTCDTEGCDNTPSLQLEDVNILGKNCQIHFCDDCRADIKQEAEELVDSDPELELIDELPV
jgi:hypothetical protein